MLFKWHIRITGTSMLSIHSRSKADRGANIREQKGVKITHRNVIANTMQIGEYESTHRKSLIPSGQSTFTDVVLGLLPQSHIYSLVVICHAGAYRGDQVIILPKFELNLYLDSIEKYRIGTLFVVRALGYFVTLT